MANAPTVKQYTNGKLHRSQYEEIYNFMLTLERDPNHAVHVSNLSIQLFHAFQVLHGLGHVEKNLLEYSALLHDIGWSIAGKKHHKHSMRLILGHEFQTLNYREQSLVAQIARYHRKALPKQSHNKFSLLTSNDQKIVRYLASLLRIADALDRNKKGLVQQIHCEWNDEHCQLFVDCDSDMEAEQKALNKKKDLFAKSFGMDVSLVQPSQQTVQQNVSVCTG